MMKKLLGIVAVSFTLTGCAISQPAPRPTPDVVSVAYGIPADCEIKDLISLDVSFQALDQTEADAKEVRNCIVGTPNSDVGIWFDYKLSEQSDWEAAANSTLKDEGYVAFDAGLEGVEVYRAQIGSEEEGISCSMKGHMGGVEFSIIEPWVECDDSWNKDLAGYVVKHAEEVF
jgi:hypothetical protein